MFTICDLVNCDRFGKVGIYGLIVTLSAGLILSVSFEIGIIAENDAIFLVMVWLANTGLLVFVLVGFSLWVRFMTVELSRGTILHKLLYVGFHLLAGYWAYFKHKGESGA